MAIDTALIGATVRCALDRCCVDPSRVVSNVRKEAGLAEGWGAMFLKPSAIVILVALGVFGLAPMAASAATSTKPVGGCALLGPKPAAKFFGGSAQVVHETNKKGIGGTVLNRGCSYSSADQLLAYTANSYASAAIATSIFKAMSGATKESTPNLFLMGADNVKISGQPGFARIHRLIPGEGEAPPAKEFLYQVVVRKGATILVEEYGANDLDSMPRLYNVAKIVVPRM